MMQPAQSIHVILPLQQKFVASMTNRDIIVPYCTTLAKYDLLQARFRGVSPTEHSLDSPIISSQKRYNSSQQVSRDVIALIFYVHAYSHKGKEGFLSEVPQCCGDKVQAPAADIPSSQNAVILFHRGNERVTQAVLVLGREVMVHGVVLLMIVDNSQEESMQVIIPIQLEIVHPHISETFFAFFTNYMKSGPEST